MEQEKFEPIGEAVEIPETVESVEDGTDKKTEKMRAVKRGAIAFVCALLIGGILGFGIMSIVLRAGARREREFSVANMSISLNEGFTRQNYEGALAAFGSRNMAIFIRNVDITTDNWLYTPELYARRMIEEGGWEAEVMEDEGLYYFTLPFVNDGGVRMVHYVYVMKTMDDFWVVQFDVRESRVKRLAPEISKYAHSIKFK